MTDKGLWCRAIAADLDPAVLKTWFHTITTMRTEIANWTARQSKHAAVAYPLITYLICLEETNTFTQYVDTLVENLHRQLKVWPVVTRPSAIVSNMHCISHV